MSSYYDFSKCVICRSQKNLEHYQGDFEVTMLLNTLYFSLMFILEKRQLLNLKVTKVVPFLVDNNIVDTYNNPFNKDDIARYLRNALAHFNIKVSSDPYNKRIEQIVLWGKNEPNKPRCANPCSQPQCLAEQFKESAEGAICSFKFSINQLRQFVNLVAEVVSAEECAFCSICAHSPANN